MWSFWFVVELHALGAAFTLSVLQCVDRYYNTYFFCVMFTYKKIKKKQLFALIPQIASSVVTVM